jgi:hypothetical protein
VRAKVIGLQPREFEAGLIGTLPPSRASSIHQMEADMGFGKGALLWLIGIPLPIILLLALFWR